MEMVKKTKTNLCVVLLVCMGVLSVSVNEAFGDIIIDNGDIGTSFTGIWDVSGGTGPYGVDSLWSRDGDTYTWQFDSEPAGIYEVLMMWSQWPSRSTDVDVAINYSGDQEVVNINQLADANQWNSLGTYYFDGSGSVTITAAFGASSTCADAVWFRYVSGNSPPTAYIAGIIPNPAEVGQVVEFFGVGEDLDGNVVTYNWESSIDGNLSDANSFLVSTLSEGVHTIYFKVADNNGIWSEVVAETLTVGELPTEFFIDNDDTINTSSAGLWQISGGADPYGADSLWSRDGATFTWNFTAPVTGLYEVSMWWSGLSSRSTSIMVEVEDRDGSSLVEINQSINSGQWNSFGMYPFEAGISYSVTIISASGSASTCADAVWVRYVTSNSHPTAFIDGVTPNPAEFGQMVEFAGSGADSDGNVVDYSWESSIDGNLSDANSFSMSTLSEGVHAIYFEVCDNEGMWSDAVIEVLTVGEIPVEILIDNDDANTSSSGLWQVSGGTDPYGADSLWSRDGTTFTWSFTAPVTGVYEVSMWWSATASRDVNISVDIENSDATATVYINQQANAGQWNAVGTYSFVEGVSYSVMITSGPAPSSTCADAVRLTLIETNIAPAAFIDSIVPNPASVGQTVTFDCHGEDSDGNVAAYSWESSIDGNLSDANTFSTSQLSLGEHTIILTVYDDKGLASDPVAENLTVEEAPIEFIIDNDDANTSSSGLWQISGGTDPYGADSLWSRDGSTFTWSFTAPVTGEYEVSMWWSATASRDTNVLVNIENVSATATVYINQQANAGQWNAVGTYSLVEGVSYSVTTTSSPGPSSTCADAVKFDLLALNMAPTAFIDSIAPNPVTVGEPVTFNCHGEDSDGNVVAYFWESSIDGNLSDANSFSTSELSLGEHVITLIVYDDKAVASEPVTEILNVAELVIETIIDNGQAGTSSTGTWSVSGGTTPYGADSLWGRDGSTYTWTFTPTVTGSHDVSMWWSGWASRDPNIPVEIESVAGLTTVYINQQENAGQWNSVGSYDFEADVSYDITIVSRPAPSSSCADAVKITY
ncbi:PKD domain-containing protein [Planctomycetota bacterium]